MQVSNNAIKLTEIIIDGKNKHYPWDASRGFQALIFDVQKLLLFRGDSSQLVRFNRALSWIHFVCMLLYIM